MASDEIEMERISVTSAKSQNDLLRFASLMGALKWSSKRSLLGGSSYICLNGGDAVQYLTSSSVSDMSELSNPTTTSMRMTNEEAKEWCRGLISAHLIQDVSSASRKSFAKSRNYTLTPKGLHVLEQLVDIDSIADDGLRSLFFSQPIPQKMLHLQRQPDDGSIVFSEPMITTFFRYFVGPKPNRVEQQPNSKRVVWAKGVPLSTIRQTSSDGMYASTNKDCFYAQTALNWLCDSTMVLGTAEAAEVAAHFARRGFIARVPRPSRRPNVNPKWERMERNRDREERRRRTKATVNVRAPGGSPAMGESGGFCTYQDTVYKITEKGHNVALWNPEIARDNVFNVDALLFSTHQLVGQFRADSIRESNTDSERLTYILQDSNLRSIFLKFTRGQDFEDSVSFYLDVQKLKPVHVSTSEETSPPPKEAIYHIYEEYLAPLCSRQLNLDEDLRTELSAYLNDIMSAKITESHDDGVGENQPVALDQMQNSLMVRLYDRIQRSIFRTLAMEVVPKFIKTPYFLALDNESCETLDITPSDADNLVQFSSQEQEDRGRVYISISKKAFQKRAIALR